MLHHEQIFTPTLAYMAQHADLVVDAQVTAVRPVGAGAYHITHLTLDVRATVAGGYSPAIAEVLVRSQLPGIEVSFFGTFFLTALVEKGAANRQSSARREPAASWRIGWDRRGILPATTSDYSILHAHIKRVVSGQEDAVALAVESLGSPYSRLQTEAADDLMRIWDVAERLTPTDAGVFLTRLRDLNYPDRERALLSDILGRIPSAAQDLQETVISLIGSGLRGNGFLLKATEVLAESTEPEAEQILLQLSYDEDYRVSAYALSGLSRLGSAPALERLAAAAEDDPDPDVREVARRILTFQVSG